MLKYILKRFLIAIPLLLSISLLSFILMRITPGNYLDTIRLDPQISEETIARYERLYQLDKPLLVQYGNWLLNMLHGEFGFSFYYNVPVTKVIGGRIGNTLLLSLSAFVFTWVLAIPLGIWVAVRRNSWIDKTTQMISYAFLSIPSFFVTILLLYWVSRCGFLPLGGMVSADYDQMSIVGKILDIAKHLLIPTIALSLGSIAGLQKIMRGNMLEVLGQKYIVAARAKGLSENKVIYKHALRNAINPLITLLGYEFSGLLSGAALTEIMCSWPGLGSLMLTAVRAKDIYLVMASMMMGSVLFIIGNLIADICLAKADPRIQYD